MQIEMNKKSCLDEFELEDDSFKLETDRELESNYLAQIEPNLSCLNT